MPLKPRAIVCHISASTFGDAEEINAWHTDRGFKMIGYHKVILNGFRKGKSKYNPALDGKIEQGRDDGNIGAHCQAGGMNKIALGVCCIGYPGQAPKGPEYLTAGPKNRVVLLRYMTRKQLPALVDALARLCERHGLDPMGTLVHEARTVHVLSQHSDHDRGKPFCASLNMAEIRKQVKAAMNLP